MPPKPDPKNDQRSVEQLKAERKSWCAEIKHIDEWVKVSIGPTVEVEPNCHVLKRKYKMLEDA